MELRFPLLLDGATGTQLQKRGYTGGKCAEQWILENPEVIVRVQREYVEKGSRVIYTPTFGANRVKLESHGLLGKVREVNLRLAELSKQAADGRAWVAGDIAPTGLFLYPLGETSFEELVDVYTEQAAALEEAGVDLFVIETMMTVAEARAALLAVKSVSRKPVFVSFTCDERGRTLSGTDVTAALVILQGMGADAFGLNCSTGPKEMLVQLKRLREYACVPLIAKPNAGLPQVLDGETVYDCPPAEFAALAGEMAEAGVCIFGGCCGTDEGHIAALAEKLKGLKPAAPAPLHPELLPCATEERVFLLDPAVACGEALPCDEKLEDRLSDALEEEGELITLSIEKAEELDNLSDCRCMLTKPLCIRCEDEELLEQALRIYQGRALYDGTLPEEKLLPLVKKYGLII